LAAQANKSMTASATTPNWNSWDGWDTNDPETPNVDFEASSEDRPISQKRIEANRQNAQHSTGAKSEAGKENLK
jgi:hypothetical protein